MKWIVLLFAGMFVMPVSAAYLRKTLEAPPRVGRELADAGRREQARRLLEQL
ncbi:hypothetical protein [Marinobacter sediminum]|uniref:hypothetical protein n=1 Tax=Marinobacter sediminum TaxID=256323 RepID=UPI00193A0521|nr:hypothetical protein [Marinobacter sediminum]